MTEQDAATDELSSNAGSDFGPAALASVASVALALYYYYVQDDKQRGQFVGLWPATILGLAIYLKLGDIKALLEQRQAA